MNQRAFVLYSYNSFPQLSLHYPRYCNKPTELIIKCQPCEASAATTYIRDLIQTKKYFLQQHQYDWRNDAGSEEFYEEAQKIPDPLVEPNSYLDQYLTVLDEFGLWWADRTAFALITQIEKAKTRTGYCRHFLLLCLVSSTFIQIRAFCDEIFKQYWHNSEERRCIERFSSPKALRLLDILREFKPDKSALVTPAASSAGSPTKVRNSVATKKGDSEISDSPPSVENASCGTSPGTEAVHATEQKSTQIVSEQKPLPTTNGHKRGRGNFGRSYRPFNPNYVFDPNALCGIIFCDSMFKAKTLQSFVAEMAKHDPDLNFLCVQYTAEKEADPITEAAKYEVEHRKQEEVLKRFRTHSCNLLIGTSVLEEGIELPRCNLVVQWDLPRTYRSYIQCKGKARTPKAYHILMLAATADYNAKTDMEFLSQESHRLICLPEKNSDNNNKELKIAIDTNGHSEQCHDSTDNKLLQLVDKREGNEALVSAQSEQNEENPKNCDEITEPAITLDSNGHPEECNGSVNHQLREAHEETETLASSSSENGDAVKEHKCHDITEIAATFGTSKTQPDSCDDSTKFKYLQLGDMRQETDTFLNQIAKYMQIEQTLLEKCANKEPTNEDLIEADSYTSFIKPYVPINASDPDVDNVNLANAIVLVNKYCSKLPSDTFTKLTPLWRCMTTKRDGKLFYQYTLRLPINSPVKQDIYVSRSSSSEFLYSLKIL